MLVLLIIFMVAAPLASVDVPVDLPGSTTQQHPRPDKPIFPVGKGRSFTGAGRHADHQGSPGRRDRCCHQQQARTSAFSLRADKSISYGDLMEVMDELRGAGYLKVALVGLEGKSAK